MKHLILLLLFMTTATSADLAAPPLVEECDAILRVESLRTQSVEELSERRREIMNTYASGAREAMCESSTSLTYDGFRLQLERANQESEKRGGPGYEPAELYFFLVCGEDQVNLSPLAYHAFNLNRDEYGFLGEMTLAIAWMSIGYLEIKDPDYDRSFMDIANRILRNAIQREADTEIEMYEDLLEQIEGFREDHTAMVEECRMARE